MADTLRIGHRPPTTPPSQWTPPDPSGLGALRAIGIGLVGMAGLSIGIVRFVGEQRFQAPGERLLQAIAWGLLVASPAVLAALSPRRRAILLAPAALLLTPLAMLSLAGVLLPLLLPAVLFWTALVTRWDRLPCGRLRGLAVVVVVPCWVIVGGIVLFAQEDPRTYEDRGTACVVVQETPGSARGSCAPGTGGGGSGGTSDVVTPIESAASIGFVSGGILAGWALATPQRARSGSGGTRGRRGR